MNRKQKWILGIGTACFCLAGLFPPWIQTVRVDGIFNRVAMPWTGCTIFGSPSPTEKKFTEFASMEIDTSRLAVIWIMIFVLTALAWWTASRSAQKE
ncbi:MAG: hypothetical protein JW902_16900 [Syntrophaceae bacterium]|nr:hypothetical protein [Syntrophaceae bacterium]